MTNAERQQLVKELEAEAFMEGYEQAGAPDAIRQASATRSTKRDNDSSPVHTTAERVGGWRPDWICEFCFKPADGDLPKNWQLVWQSAVCPECHRRVSEGGGYAKVPGGAYAFARDPRPFRRTLPAQHPSGHQTSVGEPEKGRGQEEGISVRAWRCIRCGRPIHGALCQQGCPMDGYHGHTENPRTPEPGEITAAWEYVWRNSDVLSEGDSARIHDAVRAEWNALASPAPQPPSEPDAPTGQQVRARGSNSFLVRRRRWAIPASLLIGWVGSSTQRMTCA